MATHRRASRLVRICFSSALLYSFFVDSNCSISASPTPDKVFLEACDVYFRHCHNKPYGFFSAKLFRAKVSQNQIPLHLRLALIACATRYSSRSQWKERKQSTIDGYARGAWELIISSPDGLDGNEDVSLIQTLAILGVIDATGEYILS